jgi:hypothetical protein
MSTARNALGVTVVLKVKNPHPQPLSRGERGAGRKRRGGTVIGVASVHCKRIVVFFLIGLRKRFPSMVSRSAQKMSPPDQFIRISRYCGVDLSN